MNEYERGKYDGIGLGMIVSAGIVAGWQSSLAREILMSAGINHGVDMDGASEYDIRRLIEGQVDIPGLHAAWQKARRAERELSITVTRKTQDNAGNHDE